MPSRNVLQFLWGNGDYFMEGNFQNVKGQTQKNEESI